MIGLLLVTHGDFAAALVSSAELIMGEVTQIELHGLYHGEDIEELTGKVKKSIVSLNTESGGDGVLVLVDLFGGSPSNAVAKSLYELGGQVKAECVTGVNMAILLEAATSKNNMSLKELKNHCIEVGVQSVVSLKDKLDF